VFKNTIMGIAKGDHGDESPLATHNKKMKKKQQKITIGNSAPEFGHKDYQ